MARKITDERTLAGWLSAPTEARAAAMTTDPDRQPLILHADVEEHVVDPSTNTTVRCDLTLRGRSGPLVTAEMKRPEVAQANAPSLVLDGWKKAVARGLPFFITSNFCQAYVWDTRKGPHQTSVVMQWDLVPEMTHSGSAASFRERLGSRWVEFLDELESLIRPHFGRSPRRQPLPPQAIELREAIVRTAEEAAERIRLAAANDVYRNKVLEVFRAQFGVTLSLDPLGNPERFLEESIQIATIATFVVATRLMLYQAMWSPAPGAPNRNLDPLDVSRGSRDPQRVLNDLKALYDHARRRTGDFELHFTVGDIDDILFVDAGVSTDVGARWGTLIDVITKSDWSGPSTYVPGLYESLLDEEHRHVMGVHYTPDPVAEVICAYAIRNADDVVLDPACGAGTFSSMAYSRKRGLGSTHDESLSEVYAIELADFAASLTSLGLTLSDASAQSAYPRVFREDFFRTYPGEISNLELPTVGRLAYPENVDAFIGNPPYIRFENRTTEERREILRFVERHHSRSRLPFPNFTGKADIWSFFVLGSHAYLKPGGRLGLVLSWSLLSSDYGDAVLSFLGRYFLIDIIIDSRVERWFAAAQHTLILLARKAPDPPQGLRVRENPNIPEDHQVRFVRLKQPIVRLLDSEQPRGKQAEDLVDELLSISSDTGTDVRWDVRVFRQTELVAREVGQD